MKSQLRTKALELGGKIHPLMGSVLNHRLSKPTQVGDICELCTDDDNPRRADTRVWRSNVTEGFICLEHDLMLHRYAMGEKELRAEYALEVLRTELREYTKPLWMPAKLFEALERRAERKIRNVAEYMFISYLERLLERELQQVRDREILAEFKHENYLNGKQQ